MDDSLGVSAHLGSIKLVCQVLDSFSPGWVRVDSLADLGKTQVVSHTSSEDTDELSGWATHRGRSENLVSSLANMHLDETSFAFADGAIRSRVRLREGVILNVLFLNLPGVHADVGDLRVSIGRPWHDELTSVGATKEESVADDGSSHDIRVVSELWTCSFHRHSFFSIKGCSSTISNRVDIVVGSLHLLI